MFLNSCNKTLVIVTLSQIIFVNQSTIITIAFFLFDLGSGLIISILISCHGIVATTC